MSSSTSEVIVFTDGCCINNGSPDALGSSAVLFPNGEIKGGFFYINDNLVRTNNRMEYYAAIMAMELMNEFDPTNQTVLHIYSDSMLLINTCEKWMEGWEKKGWPERIKNKDLVKRLYKLCHMRKIKWTHVKSHQKDNSFETKWNNLVDKCANSSVHGDDISNVKINIS